MALRVIYGRAGSGKTTFCLEEIAKELRQAPLGAPLIFLVPEQATFEAERELAKNGALFRAQVFGFRRLAQSVLRETGGAACPPITDLAKRMVLRQILVENEKEFTLLRQAARQKTFTETSAALISECKAYGVAPDDLAAAGEKLAGSPLGAKLADLALVYGRYEAHIRGRYTDPEDYLALLDEKIAGSELLAGAQVYVDGFDWFTAQEYRALAALAGVTANLTVTLCLDDPSLSRSQQPEALFYRQWQTYNKLKYMARELGLTWEEAPLKGPGRFRDNPLLQYVEAGWAGLTVNAPEQADGVVLAEAANRRSEIEGMARDIVRCCRDRGYRWRDIAVLVRDEAGYADLITTVFGDYGIPFFYDRRQPAAHHPLAELLRSAVEVMTERWSYEPVFRALKTGLFELPLTEIDLLENYVLEFGIRGSRWTKAEPWSYIRRYSLDEDQDAGAAQESLDRINAIRSKVTEPFTALEKGLRKAMTGSGYTQILYEFLLSLGVPDTLEQWAREARLRGDLVLAEEHEQYWTSVCQLFDQIVDCAGDQAMSLGEYGSILNEGLDSLSLGLIPPGLDYVTVTALDRIRLLKAKAAYLPGVNEGVLPGRGKGEGLLSDKERLALQELGVELAPGSVSEAFAENYLVYTALTRAGSYLWVSYALADAEGQGLLPSLVVKRLRELVAAARPDKKFPLKPLRLAPVPGEEKEYAVHPRRAISALAVSLRQADGRLEALTPAWWDIYNASRENEALRPYLAKALAGLFHTNQEAPLSPYLARRLWLETRRVRMRGSVSAFESFKACPFQHFVRYGLRLRERPVYRLEPPGLGLFLHAVLKRFGDAVRQSGRDWGDLDQAEAGKLCGAVISELAPKLQNEILLSSAQYRHLEGRIRATVEQVVWRLAEFDRASRFKPVALEQAFGLGQDSLPPVALCLADGTELELAGQIDRLDCVEHQGKKYFLVIDYKSGGAWLSLLDVYHGLRLQLLLYLLAACRLGGMLSGGEEILPAGVLYYFLKKPSVTGKTYLAPELVEKEIKKAMKMPGWVIADLDIIKLLDGSDEFTKIALNKDGSVRKNTQQYMKTAAEFQLLMEHVETQCKTAAEQVLSGEIGIRPYKLADRTACGLCRYQPVCQFDRLLADNDFLRLAALDDAVILSLLASGRETK